MSIHRKLAIAIAVPALVATLGAGTALGKGHVPAGEVQVAHRGVVKQLPSPALTGHARHGDLQLPACDFANIFIEGDDASNVTASSGAGVTYSDLGFIARDSAEGLTPACPLGTF